MRYYLIYFFALISTFTLYGESTSDLFHQANDSYKKGLQATTWQERLTALNEALFLYTEIEKNEGPSLQINQALGDLYLELSAYPWAILYDERSLKQKPHDPQILSHLNIAQKKLGLELTTAQQLPFWRIVLLDSILSQPTRLQLFFWGSLLTLLFGTLFIGFKRPILKKMIYLSGGLTTLLLLSYFALFYFTPIEGIIVSSTGLYRAASPQAAQLVPTPLSAGEKVRVIDHEQEGYWLKIINSDEKLGYIPSDTIRII